MLLVMLKERREVMRAALETLTGWCLQYDSVVDVVDEQADVASMVETQDAAVRLVLVLVEAGKMVVSAAGPLMVCVKDEDERRSLETRRDAALALSHLASKTRLSVDVLPALVESMRWVGSSQGDRNLELRAASAAALAATLDASSEAREAALPLVPELVALLNLPCPTDVVVALGVLASHQDHVPHLLACAECVPTLARLVYTHTPRGAHKQYHSGNDVFRDRDRLAAAASNTLANLCATTAAARDALAQHDVLRVLVEAVAERSRLLETNFGGKRKKKLNDDALDAALLATTNATTDHRTNADRAVACGALSAILASLPFSLDSGLRALHTLVHGQHKHRSSLRNLRPESLLHALEPRTNSELLRDLIKDVAGDAPHKKNNPRSYYPQHPTTQPPKKEAWPEPTIKLKGGGGSVAAAKKAALLQEQGALVNLREGDIVVPRPATASQYSPYRRTSLW